MGSDDKGKEYPCMCGKVFRRQLALERHVDVHHSSKSSVSHKCDVCGKTFGSRNTLTMHRTVHANPTAPQGSPHLDEIASEVPLRDNGGPVECKLEPSSPIDAFSEMHYIGKLASEEITVKEDEKEDEEEEDEKEREGSLESSSRLTDDLVTCGAYHQSGEDEIAIRNQSTDLLSKSTPIKTEHGQAPSAKCVPISGVVTVQDSSVSASNVFDSNEGTDQSMDFSDMVAEEIVSESLFQTSDQEHWSNKSDSDVRLHLRAPNDTTSADKVDAKLQKDDCIGSSEPTGPPRRVNKVKPETRKIQSRGSEEESIDVEMIYGYEEDSSQKGPANSTIRQQQLPSSTRTPFICGICHKNFDSEKYLSMHMPLHKPYLFDSSTEAKMSPSSTTIDIQDLNALQGQQPSNAKQKKVASTEVQHWTCQYCNKLFMQNSNYKNHMRTHSDERPFVCEICNIGFKERYHLKKHVLFKHTTDLKEKCRVCGKCFKDSTAVRAHERIHSEIRPYSCPLCGKTFKTSECLWHHENRSKTCGKSAIRRLEAPPSAVTSVILPNVSEVASVRRTRKPRQGGGASKPRMPRRSSVTSTPSGNTKTKDYDDVMDDALNSEIESSVLAIKAEPECDLFDPSLQNFFSTDQELDSFWEILGSDGDTNREGLCAEETGSDLTDSDNGFIAKDCEDFSAKYKGLECTKCVKKFSSTTTFEKHMVMHNEERPYRCTVCDNGFKLKVHLKKHHLYRHSNEYPCECSICGKRFKDSSAVRLHEKIHSSDRPFRCHCGKGFKTRENLWGHRNRGPCEKTQDFITNNISLFRTTEFGPILGVPITNGQGMVVASNLTATPITDSSFISNTGRALDISQVQAQAHMQSVLLKAANDGIGVPHSMQFVPSCVISAPDLITGQASRQLKVATLKFIKPRSNNMTTQQTTVLPTAIVTPLLRDGTKPSPSLQSNGQSESKNTLKTVAISNIASKNISPLQSNVIAADSRNLFTSNTITSTSGSTFVATECPNNAVTETACILSAAQKCPTVQKFLEMGSTTNRSLGINQFLINPVHLLDNRCESMNNIAPKRRKLNSIGDDNSSTEGEGKASRNLHEDEANIFCADTISSFLDQESQNSRSLSYVDPLLTNSPRSSSQLSIYPGMDDYDDMKYDPNDPTLNIGDVYWGDSDNTLSSGWLLENENLFSDLPLTSTFGTL